MQQAVGGGDVVRGQVLQGLGDVIEVVGASLVVVVPLVVPVQLEMRTVRDSATDCHSMANSRTIERISPNGHCKGPARRTAGSCLQQSLNENMTNPSCPHRHAQRSDQQPQNDSAAESSGKSVRATNVPVGRSRTAVARSAVQLIQDAALFDGVRHAAAGAQGFQVFLQRAQFADSLADMPEMLVEQGVDLSTVL